MGTKKILCYKKIEIFFKEWKKIEKSCANKVECKQ